MKLIDNTNINVIHRHRETDKPTAVFIHGDGQNHTVFNRISDYFSHKGHSTLSYDVPGHGLSQPYKKKEYTYPRFAQTLHEILKAYTIKSPIIIGNSSGGMIAMQYATEKKAKSIIAISSCDESPARQNPALNQILENYIIESRKSFQKQMIFDYTKEGLDDKETGMAALKHTHPGATEGSITSLRNFDITSELNKIKTPVFLLNGSDDPFVTEECSERMKENISNSRLVTYQGQGHHILLKIPEKIIRTIEENYSFLTQ